MQATEKIHHPELVEGSGPFHFASPRWDSFYAADKFFLTAVRTLGMISFLTTMDDQTFITRFEASQFSMAEWRHRDHIKIAYLYLRRYPFEQAMDRLREGIQALNAVHGVPDLPTRGYHETVTQAWLALVYFTLCEYGPAGTADIFYEQNPQLSVKTNLRLFYSRETLMSARAKREHVEPDLTALPRSTKKILAEPASASH